MTFCGLLCLGPGSTADGMDSAGLEGAALKLRLGHVNLQEMPPFTLRATNGQAVGPADLRGRVVLLNFWATWCGPCKEEMPALDRLRKHFETRDVVVLTITTDHQRDSIIAFMRHLGLSLPVLLDEARSVSDSYMVRALPTTFVLGRDGRPIGRAVGPRDWDGPDAVALIDGLLKDKE